MKKIININLSGRVIPIEDSAYEKLQSYIESLRRYFINEEGRDEIINDIESRIAELMSEKIRLGAAAIADADVDQIIASMGRPEDFGDMESETIPGDSTASQTSASANSETYTERRRNRLYRDSSDRMVAGVCGGIANYINIDPAIIRLLFAIITFGGFGAGILIYLLLWFIVPERDLDQYEGKRLYRSIDDRVFGGVAGGMAAYFGREPWVIRLIFSVPLLVNIFFGIIGSISHQGVYHFFPNLVFGSVTGTFILAYIVLWIVLPEARSQYQKMEMRGEKVDVNTIRKNVKDEMQQTKDRVKGWGNEVKEAAKNINEKAREITTKRGPAMASEFREAARRTSNGIGHIIGVIFKAFFLFIAGTIAFALLVALMGLIFSGINIWPLKSFILDGFWENVFAWGTLVLFLGVPLVAFITWLLRRIMKIRSQRNYLGWTFGALWTLGWISAAFFAASITNDFRMSNYKKPGDDLAITQPANGKMIVMVSEPEVEYSGSIPWIDISGAGMDITDDTFKLSNVRLRIEQSKDADYHVEVKRYSRGRTIQDAEDRSRKMKFNIGYKDSILDVGSSIAIDKQAKFRGQQAIIVISVPTGKKIRFDESIDKLHEYNIRVRESRRWNRYERDFDIDMDEFFNYNIDVDYVMGENGQLINPNKPAQSANKTNDYRYKEEDTVNQGDMKNTPKSVQDKIDEIKKNKEENDKKLDQQIKDLEKKQPSHPGAFINDKSEKETMARATPTPLVSLTSMFN